MRGPDALLEFAIQEANAKCPSGHPYSPAFGPDACPECPPPPDRCPCGQPYGTERGDPSCYECLDLLTNRKE